MRAGNEILFGRVPPIGRLIDLVSGWRRFFITAILSGRIYHLLHGYVNGTIRAGVGQGGERCGLCALECAEALAEQEQAVDQEKRPFRIKIISVN